MANRQNAADKTLEEPPEAAVRVIERPDGCYWFDEDTGAEFGPFRTVAEALADANLSEDAELALEPGSALHQVEEEIGLADWIDPDTGQPAEGYSPHIEDH